MLAKKTNKDQGSLFFSLEDTLSNAHPLYILANKMDWQKFEVAFSPLYCLDNGRPAKPIRLMCGLLILKHIRNLSDESIVEQWSENIYYQYFCGMNEIAQGAPCNASELVHFRQRIGERGVELIFQESINVNGDDSNDPHVSIDMTVQEKNITYPTDDKLYKKIIKKCIKIADKEGIILRQSYKRVVKSFHMTNASEIIHAIKKRQGWQIEK